MYNFDHLNCFLQRRTMQKGSNITIPPHEENLNVGLQKSMVESSHYRSKMNSSYVQQWSIRELFVIPQNL